MPNGNQQNGNDKLYDLLPTSLAVLTALLGTVGGLTGGIARMVRNHPNAAMWTLGVGVFAIAAALLARLARSGGKVSTTFLVLAIAAFVGSMTAGIWLAVDTSDDRDRPTITAELSQTASGAWTLEGTAGASGLPAEGSMQVFVYAFPTSDENPRSELFFATIGPNGEGVVSQKFRIPLPADQAYRSFVVTAAVGDEVRYCNGKPLQIGAGLRAERKERDDGKSACVSFTSPVQVTVPSAGPSD